MTLIFAYVITNITKLLNMKKSKSLSILASVFPVIVIFSGFCGIVLTVFSIAYIFGFIENSENTIEFSIIAHENEDSENVEDVPFYSEKIPVINSSAKENRYTYKLCDREKNEKWQPDNKKIGIKDDSTLGRVLGSIYPLVQFILIFLILKEMTEIFISLDSSIKNNEWFSIDNYRSLKRIAYIMIGISFISIMYNLTYYFMLDEIFFNGERVYILPDLSFLGTLFYVLIIFIIAHVYKAGIEMREEQDLTI